MGVGVGGLNNHFQGQVEEFPEKINELCSRLKPFCGADPHEMSRESSCLVIWDQFDPVAPREVDRVLCVVNSTISP